MTHLITDDQNNEYTYSDLIHSLEEVGAFDCKYLFLHTDVSFGNLAKGIGRKAYLELLYQALTHNKDQELIVPVFTFSFCNDEVYDVVNSRTVIGGLNEYIRVMDGRYRTLDPLLSLSVPVSLKNRFEGLGNHSLDENSAFQRVHELDDVKFLFLGAELGSCFTYVHFVEKITDVKYRFDKEFEGEIIDYDQNRIRTRQYIHTACRGVLPAEYHYFADELQRQGMLKKVRFGNRNISCLSEKDAYNSIKNKLNENDCYFLERPYTDSDLVHEYTFNNKEGRITHC